MSAPRFFRSGPPPSLGWWPASCIRTAGDVATDTQSLRFWDGYFWSAPCGIHRDSKYAGKTAPCKVPNVVNHSIVWAPRPDSWPQESLT